ncbi:MAG: cation:proton antiporter, partial [Desulfobacterales bacterium]|nr:cation:proton antiporter [Desulfobacterales bacterium]
MTFDLSFLHTSLLTLLGIAAVAGFYMGHLARRAKLPALIGYMIFGVIIGPSVLNIFDEPSIERLSFIAEIGLGFVAVTIGSELRISSLKRVGWSIVFIIFAESFMAFLVVAGALYLLTSDIALAIMFGAMAPASAPAGTVAVIQE